MTDSIAAPIDDRWFEDYQVGIVVELGSISASEAEIVAFARQFDPQPIHTQPEWAKTGPFKGLIASGWHTVALMMRLIVDHFISHNSGLASPGVDEVRWFKPLRPGDKLSVRATVVEAKPSRSKPDRGMVRTRFEAFNADGELIASFSGMNLYAKRAVVR